MPAPKRPAARPPQAEEEHPHRPGPHQDQLQQHDRLAHRPRGQRHRVGVRRRRRLQGLAQVDAVRRAGHGRRRRPQGHRAGPAEGRGLRQGPGLGPRDGDPLAPGRRPRGHRRQGRHAAGPQRLPPAQAAGASEPWLAIPQPQCKQCRREGQKLFLKGERCLTDKCGVERRAYPPGDHGRGRQKQSEYRVQLREKQKARRYYGVLEKQFRALLRQGLAPGRASPARTC